MEICEKCGLKFEKEDLDYKLCLGCYAEKLGASIETVKKYKKIEELKSLGKNC